MAVCIRWKGTNGRWPPKAGEDELFKDDDKPVWQGSGSSINNSDFDSFGEATF
jgi:hypothetical protein